MVLAAWVTEFYRTIVFASKSYFLVVRIGLPRSEKTKPGNDIILNNPSCPQFWQMDKRWRWIKVLEQ